MNNTKIVKSEFGKTSNGEIVELYTLSNSSGIEIGILTYGGIISFLKVPDKTGNLIDIVLGFDNVAGYENGGGYLGALIGRCANRICKGRFTLGNKEYSLACNDKGNHLHGGIKGFNSKVWSAEVKDNKLVLSLVSPDGEEGYPGRLNVSVTHSLSDDGTFTWDYFAETDSDTICNLTNHAYFNLSGHNSGNVLKHKLKLQSDFFTETDDKLIPTGKTIPVEGTPLDFREEHYIGERINQDYLPLKLAGGYDHNFAVRGKTGVLRDAAFCHDEKSGISIELKTTLPGVQLYTGNFLNDIKGKGGAVYQKNSGFCLETQFFPDAVNHPHFEQPLLKAGETYHHTTYLKLISK
jgi:aldose 1-epimerase